MLKPSLVAVIFLVPFGVLSSRDAMAPSQEQHPSPAEPTGLNATVTYRLVSLRLDDPMDIGNTGYRILRRNSAIHGIGDCVVHPEDTCTYADIDPIPEVWQ